MKAIITSIVILLSAMSIQAQQLNPMTDTLVWTYTQLKNLRNQESVSADGAFRVNQNSSIDWVQKNGEVTFTFNITGRTGNWTNAEANGSITYAVTYEASNGTIKVSRTAEGVTIEMDIDNPSRPNTQYNFTITTVQSHTN
jgi:hypothetical protein